MWIVNTKWCCMEEQMGHGNGCKAFCSFIIMIFTNKTLILLLTDLIIKHSIN